MPKPGPGAPLLPGAQPPPTPYGRSRDPFRLTLEKDSLRKLPSQVDGLEQEHEALDAAIEAEKQARGIKSDVRAARHAQARCHTKIGNIHFARGDYSLAAEAYQCRVDVARKSGDEAGLARGLGNVANALSRLNVQKACDAYHDCLSRATALRDIETQYKALAGLAATLKRAGDFVKAQELNDRLIHLRRSMAQNRVRSGTRAAGSSPYVTCVRARVSTPSIFCKPKYVTDSHIT